MDSTMDGLLHDLGYSVPAGISGVLMACFFFYFKYLERRHDKDRDERMTKENRDREEHLKKWEDMIALHNSSAAINKESLDRIINNHQADMDRQFKISERQASSLELLNGHLSRVIREINT